MSSFYLSLEVQNSIVYAQRILFCFSTIFNIIAFICLLKNTPENQKKFRNYLLYMQVLTAVNDINLDVAVEPFPLFPAIGGYCKGFVCQWNVPIQYSFATTVFLLGNIGGSIIICFLYRHQTIIRGRFKLNEKTLRILRVWIIAAFSSPGIFGFSLYFDKTKTEELIDNYAYGDLSWMRERAEMYVLFVRSPGVVVVFPIVTLIVLFVAVILLTSMLTHIVWFIDHDTHHSSTSKKRNRHALLILSTQLLVPTTLLIIPATIIMVCLLWETLIPFEVCQIAFFSLYPHTLTHSLVLLAVTPAYRRLITRYLQNVANKRSPACISISEQTLRSQ